MLVSFSHAVVYAIFCCLIVFLTTQEENRNICTETTPFYYILQGRLHLLLSLPHVSEMGCRCENNNTIGNSATWAQTTPQGRNTTALFLIPTGAPSQKGVCGLRGQPEQAISVIDYSSGSQSHLRRTEEV